MCLRFAFLLITRLAADLQLSRREETWKNAEILILRHQLTVLRRNQPCRPKLTWADRALFATLLSVIPKARGLLRLARRDAGRRGPPAKLAPVKATALARWPAEPLSVPCDHAGLLLLLPAMTQIGLPDLISQAGYPATRELSSWQSIGALLLAKCARRPRVHHAGTLADDEELAFALGLSALPKTTHLGTYSSRVRRDSNRELLDRADQGAAAARAGHRRSRVQLAHLSASAASPSSPAWRSCPHRSGNPPPSPGPAATGGPDCTKT